MKEKFINLSRSHNKRVEAGSKLGDTTMRQATGFYNKFNLAELFEKNTSQYELFLLCFSNYSIKKSSYDITRKLMDPDSEILSNLPFMNIYFKSLEKRNDEANSAVEALNGKIADLKNPFIEGKKIWPCKLTLNEVEGIANRMSTAYLELRGGKLRKAIEGIKADHIEPVAVQSRGRIIFQKIRKARLRF